MTLALLLTAVTGAWAEETPLLTIENKDYESFTSGSKTFDDKVTVTFSNSVSNSGDAYGWFATSPASLLTVAGTNGYTITSCKFYTTSGTANTGYSIVGESPSVYLSEEDVYTDANQSVKIGSPGITKIEVYGTAEAPITVEPGASANTWTFTMPGSDVVLTPIYANAAAFVTTGTGSEAKTLLPEAAEGVIAGTDASLIAEGTGIVANIGETTTAQGTLMYAIGTSATEAPELTAFSATAPTAENIADAATVYVWYYIQGANAPEGEAATLDNTFNDTEPVCLTVQVLTNKFDITLNAANANTIEAGKATVTVGGEAATVTEGKLQGVKMGSEVKLEAKPGYKFRKVEAKKGAAAKPLANATTEDLGKVIGADGNIYDTKAAAEAANTNAVAMICYVVEGHGLALALTDEVDKMNWSTAQTTCDAHTPAITGGKWMLASKGEWNNMISAAGSYTALRDGFSSVSGTNMQSEGYWSSTEDDSSDAWNYYFSNGLWSDVSKNWNRCVRACLAF